MFIKQEIAQCIVEQLKDVINQDLNFITVNGKILASTNKDRINTYHEAAVIAVKKNKMVITEFDNQYEGTRKGINLLLKYKKDVIGVIGVTGDVTEVLKYGEIIQKMAEILILENYSQAFSISIRERDRHIIEEIFRYNENSTENENFFGPFENSQLLRTLVIKTNTNKYNFTYIFENLLIEKFDDSKVFHFIKNENLYYILTSIVNKQRLKSILNELQDELNSFVPESVKVGIGTSGIKIKDIQTSFKESRKSLEWSELFKHENYLFYEKLNLGAILTSVPNEVQINYARKIISDIPTSEFKKLQQVLYCYGKHNCSITACAGELHMHKNTFQYQLNKIKTHTGFDPKNIEEYVVLKIAFLVSDLSKLPTKI